MRKRGLCCCLMSVRLSLRMSVPLSVPRVRVLYPEAEDIAKLPSQPGSSHHSSFFLSQL